MNDYIVLFAFEYALQKEGYEVSEVCDFLQENWDKLNPLTQGMIAKKIDYAFNIKSIKSGDTEKYWLNLMDSIAESKLELRRLSEREQITGSSSKEEAKNKFNMHQGDF